MSSFSIHCNKNIIKTQQNEERIINKLDTTSVDTTSVDTTTVDIITVDISSLDITSSEVISTFE